MGGVEQNARRHCTIEKYYNPCLYCYIYGRELRLTDGYYTSRGIVSMVYLHNPSKMLITFIELSFFTSQYPNEKHSRLTLNKCSSVVDKKCN